MGERAAAVGKTGRRPGRPPQSSSEETRLRILDASLTAFAAHGFDGARLKDIADGAGVHTALVHHYYGDKGRLYAAVVDRALAPIKEQSTTLLTPDMDVRLILEGLVSLLTYFFHEHREILLLITRESLAGGHHLNPILMETLKPVYVQAVAFFESARAKGQVPNLEPAHMVITVVGAVAMYFTHPAMMAQLTGEDPLSSAAVEHRRVQLVAMLHALLLVKGLP